MAPMKSLQYFQPMQHKPLKAISNYALATDKPGAEHMVIVKPTGLDVYISAGRIFDFKQREICNTAVTFQLEKATQASLNTSGVYVGVLTSTDRYFEKKIPRLYDFKPVSYKDITFVVYDVVFPLFDADVDYRWRYDVAKKVVGIMTNCKPADVKVIRNSFELMKISADLLKEDISRTLIVYKANGKYIYGDTQLLLISDNDLVSYQIKAEQKFRAHIKRVNGITEHLPNGDKYETAASITVKFKHDFIDIELPDNKVLCKSIWDFRKVLKPYPLWFTGYTAWDTETNGYVTYINNFHSFIF